MKKIMMIAAMMVATLTANAQHEVGTLTLQPKVGMNIANLTKIEGGKARIGLAAGAELEYQVADIVSLSAGALYSMQGIKGKEDGLTVTLKNDYINVPVMCNVYFAKGLAVKAGVQPGFKASSKVKAEFGGESASASYDGLKSFDFSIPVGLSYEYNNVVLDARYDWGLTKTFKDLDNKNTVFQFTVGYKFAL